MTCQKDYLRITDLVWDPNAQRRDAACVFASRFVMQEDWALAIRHKRSFLRVKFGWFFCGCKFKGHHGPAQRKCWLWSQKAGTFLTVGRILRNARCFERLARNSDLEHFHGSESEFFGTCNETSPVEAFKHAAGVSGRRGQASLWADWAIGGIPQGEPRVVKQSQVQQTWEFHRELFQTCQCCCESVTIHYRSYGMVYTSTLLSGKICNFQECSDFVVWAARHLAWRIGMLWQVSLWMMTWGQIITSTPPSWQRPSIQGLEKHHISPKVLRLKGHLRSLGLWRLAFQQHQWSRGKSLILSFAQWEIGMIVTLTLASAHPMQYVSLNEMTVIYLRSQRIYLHKRHSCLLWVLSNLRRHEGNVQISVGGWA